MRTHSSNSMIIHRQIRSKNNGFIFKAGAIFIVAFLFFVHAEAAHAANGCCLKTNPPSQTCSDPACTLLCFSMPDYASCQKLDNGYQWNSGTCFSLSQCADKLPHSCCVKTEGDKTTCIAAYREEQCQALGATFSVAGCNTGTNSAKCAGNYEDPAVAGDTKPVSGDASAATPETSGVGVPKIAIPTLSIRIPGLDTLSEPGGSVKEGYVIPWIGQYLSAIYAWALGLVGILAITMIVIGGVRWITAGGDSSKVSGAKGNITNAVIGLILAFGSYLILYTLNPDLVAFKALQIIPTSGISAAGSTGAEGGKANEADIAEGAKMAGADPCAVLAACEHESGLRFVWNNWPNSPKEKSPSFGACGMMAENFKDGTSLDAAIRAKFSEWPALGSDDPTGKTIYDKYKTKIDLFLSNGKLNGFGAGKITGRAPTVQAMAGYAVGSGNVTRWQEANGFSPSPDFTMAQAVAMGAAAAVDAAHIPESPSVTAGSKSTCKDQLYTCGPYDLENPAYKLLKGYKAEPGGIVGKCGGKDCYTLLTRDTVIYQINSYRRFDGKYKCTGGGKK